MNRLLRKMMAALAEGKELEEVLTELGASPGQVARALASAAGEQELDARRRVGETQTELQARRHAAAAVRKLCALMEQEKGELQLKAAVALLGLAHEKQGKGSRAPVKKPPVNEAEVKEWMMAISKVLLERRQGASIGPPPRQKEAR